MMSDARTIAGLSTHHVGITVSDLERSLEFYCDTLGFELLRRGVADGEYLGRQTGYEGVRLAAASLRPSPDSPQTIELVQYLTHAAAPRASATNEPATAHLCFQTPDIHQAYETLIARGVSTKSEPVKITSGPNTGGWVLYFYDPDRFTLELFEPAKQAD